MVFKTADLCDEYGTEVQVCLQQFNSYGGLTTFAGKIETVQVYEDNVLVRRALETIPAGSVLVVDGGGSNRCALLGDRLGAIAEQRGLAGIIINGYVRDTEQLKNLKIGVLALGSNPRRSNKEGKGSEKITVNFGNIDWEQGSFVYVDEDGVIVAAMELGS